MMMRDRHREIQMRKTKGRIMLETIKIKAKTSKNLFWASFIFRVFFLHHHYMHDQVKKIIMEK
jgi:hypothetical protein